MDINKLLKPQKLCLVGASDKEGFGGDTLRNMTQNMDMSRVFLVNPKREEIWGHKCYPSIAAVPENFDLVIIATPQRTVLQLLQEAHDKGARAAVVYASGYAETGTEEGKKLEAELVAHCSALDIALMGPNCGGFVNYRDASYAFAFISAERDRVGSVGLISQSGQVAMSAIDSRKMRFSYAISSGNSNMVTVEDYLEFMVNDKDTKVIALYLEGVKNTAQFVASLKKAAIKRKPVIVLKTGRSEKGMQIASSHTGSLAGSDRIFEAVFDKYGVIRVDDIEELLATANAFDTIPSLPKTSSLCAMCFSGGETAICADMGELLKLNYPDFETETYSKLKTILPSYATPNNPLDSTASIANEAEIFANALQVVLDDSNISFVVMGYSLLYEVSDPTIHYMYQGLKLVMERGINIKPMVMLPFLEDARNPDYHENLHRLGIPVLPPPLYGMRIIKNIMKFVDYDLAKIENDLAIPEGKPAPGLALSEHESKELLRNTGITIPEEKVATTEDEAAKIAASIGYPVVMKIHSADILHKTEAGGVLLGIKDESALREGWKCIIDNAKAYCSRAKIDGVLIQKQVSSGQEVIIGIKNDAQFGPCIMCGLGGVFVELFKDTALACAPVNAQQAQNMLESLKSYKLLSGYRGKSALDVKALSKTIVAVSEFAAANKDKVFELDLNPVFVYREGVCVVDALAVLCK